MPRRPPNDVAHVHLEVLSETHVLEVPVRVGDATPLDVLTPARALSAGVMDRVAASARSRGKTPSCRLGCSSCCHHLVPIAVVEAVALAEAVAREPPERRDAIRERFAKALRTLESQGLLAATAAKPRAALVGDTSSPEAAWRDVSTRYFAARIPCPLLEDGACALYDERPLVCREYVAVTPPERCERLDGGVEVLPRPIDGSEAVATATREVGITRAPMVPLPLALEWAAAEEAAFRADVDGEALAMALFAALDPRSEVPLSERRREG